MDSHAERDLLTRLVADLDAATVWGDAPLLAAAAGSPSDPVLVLVDLADAPPAASFAARLVGLTAPPDWLAVAVVAEGWASALAFETSEAAAHATLRPSLQPDRRRLRSVHAVGRLGGAVGRLRWRDDDAVEDHPGPAVGAVHDCLLRMLDVTTAPPDAPVDELFALLWLHDCLAEAGRDHRLLSWPRAARLHPALQLLATAGRCPRRVDPAELVEAARLLGVTSGWADVRARVIERGWLPGLVTPAQAAWMDEGMFARWLLGGFPPLRALLADARRLALRPDAAARAEAALRDLGLLEPGG